MQKNQLNTHIGRIDINRFINLFRYSPRIIYFSDIGHFEINQKSVYIF